MSLLKRRQLAIPRGDYGQQNGLPCACSPRGYGGIGICQWDRAALVRGDGKTGLIPWCIGCACTCHQYRPMKEK